MQLMWQHQL